MVVAGPASVATPSVGTASINPDGTIRYTPPLDFFGRATVNYVVEDTDGETDTGTLTITIKTICTISSNRT